MNNLKKEYLEVLKNSRGEISPSLKSFFTKSCDFEREYNKEIERFDQEDIKNFLRFFAKTSPNSLSVYFSRLKKYYQYLAEHKGITSLTSHADMKYADYKDFVCANVYNSRIITREQLHEGLGKIANPCDRLLLLLIFAGIKGYGNQELLNLKESDVDFDRKVITVKRLVKVVDTENCKIDDNGKVTKKFTYLPEVREFEFDFRIETELRNTLITPVYLMKNGSGNMVARRRNRVDLIEKGDYIFKPIDSKLNLKRDKSTSMQLSSQSIQRRVLNITHNIMGYDNLTLQTLYISGVIQRLVDLTKETGSIMNNLEVRNWIKNQGINATKQEIYEAYRERIEAEARATDTTNVNDANQLSFNTI